MASCELCGRSMKGRGRSMVIEGASMLVCPQCATKFGNQSVSSGPRSSSAPRTRPSWIGGPEKPTPSRPRKPSTLKPKTKPRSGGILLDDMDLIEDYAKAIRTARQKKNFSQEELAQKIGERISTLQSIESGRLKPIGKTIRGLERELEISLLEAVGTAPIKVSKGGSEAGPTLGDRVIVKRKISQKARQEDAKEN
ncbi:MAG: TIGR00270 family protein [Candidatus Thorarchaeota archaeon]|nr:MAG: TIGR00270 family protein [Candidatus Thorarchaeota archaeon]